MHELCDKFWTFNSMHYLHISTCFFCLGMFKTFEDHEERKQKKDNAAHNEDFVKDGEKKQRGRPKKMDAAQVPKKVP